MCWINALPGLIRPGEKLSKPAWVNHLLHCFYSFQYIATRAVVRSGGSNGEEKMIVKEELQDTSPFLYFYFSFDS